MSRPLTNTLGRAASMRRPRAPRALTPAQKMEKMRRWVERNEGIPIRGDKRAGFDMGKFWDSCCSGTCHKELFAAALSKSSKMKAEHEAYLERRAARAELPRFSKADKMEKMRLWFEHNEGVPLRGDKSAGFDLGVFWHDCCRGNNEALFAAALSESSKMKAAHELPREDGARAQSLTAAQKMQTMRLWFEQNAGKIPRQGDKSAGFDMGAFWNSCWKGKNAELLAAALPNSPEMEAAHTARLEGKAARAAAAARKREHIALYFDTPRGEGNSSPDLLMSRRTYK